MQAILLILQVVVAQLLLSSTVLAQAGLGQFKGEVIAKFLRDGRNMRLEQPFGYVDPKGQAWDVPAGTETDGASIPRVLWVTHPPFTGKYRAAAVVHDYYCQTKSRDWKATHEVFYHAMRAAGVEDKTAKVMYAAVYYFGPRWGRGGTGEARATGAVQELPFEDQARLFDQLRSWIESEGPDIEGIARRIDAGNLSAPPSEARVALVIGNSAYKYAPALENPKNDAGDIAVTLEKLGFQVITGIDLDKSGMERAIRQFAQALGKGKVGLFFFAGHGLQVGGRNYLVPVDARLEDASGLDFELIRADLVQRTMERETKTNIVFLDACRDNPLARNLARSMGTRSTEVGRGLAAVESGVGTLISFSTQPGNVALDGKGRNSPFAGALVQQLLAGRGDLADMLIGVRRSVMQVTANRQVPWEHSSLTDRFYFSPPSASGAAVGLTYAEQAELAFWNAVKDSKQAAVVKSYIEAYPDGAFVVVAKAIIDGLEGKGSGASSKTTVASLDPIAPPECCPFDGRWRVVRVAPSCKRNPKGEFAIEIWNSRIRSSNEFGQVEADGKIEFKLARGVYSGRLVGNSGQAEYKGGWNGSSFSCGGQATLTKLDVPTDAPSDDLPSDLPDDPKQLAELLQKELQRVGCYSGTIDGDWGLGSRSAMSSFNLYTSMALPSDQPDPRAAAIVQKTLTRVCPADARAAAPAAASAPASRAAPSSSGCQTESLDECKVRVGPSSRGTGACLPQNRRRVC
jgi:hypothetical protein